MSRAFLLGVGYVFLAAVAVVGARSYAEAAFLTAYGVERLPQFFVAEALAFACATFAYEALAPRVRVGRLDGIVILAFAACAGCAGLLAGPRGAALFIVALHLVGLSSIVSLAAWNTLASTVAGRAARRWLPRAGAAVTAGGVIAGFGAGVLIARRGLGSFTWPGAGLAAALLACAVAAGRLTAAAPAPPAPAPPAAFGALARRLVVWLALAAVVEAVVATLVELQFKVRLKAAYPGDRVGVAIAFYYGLINLILLPVQALAMPRVLVTRRLPVTSSVHPLSLAGALVTFVVAPGLATTALSRVLDRVGAGSTARTSQEVSLSVLPPVARRRWKTLLRGGATPLGLAAAGGALAFVPEAAGHPRALASVAGVLCLGLFLAVRRAADAYLAALAAPLGMSRAVDARAGAGLELSEKEKLVELAGDPEPMIARLAGALLVSTNNQADELAPFLPHENARVRVGLYHLSTRRPDRDAVSELRAAVAIEDEPAPLAAGLRALAAHGDGSAAGRAYELARASGPVALAAAAYRAQLGLEAATPALLGRLLDGEQGWLAWAGWASALVDEGRLDEVLVERMPQPEAFRCALGAGGEPALIAWRRALSRGDAGAHAALAVIEDAELRPGAAARLVGFLARSDVSPRLRALVVQAVRLPAARWKISLLRVLLADADGQVRTLAARRLGEQLRDGGCPAGAGDDLGLEHVLQRELDGLDGCLASRAAGPPGDDDLRREAELAVERVLAVSALAGRQPALQAAARRLRSSSEADRRRALDVIQEVLATSPRVLALVERYLAVPAAAPPAPAPVPSAPAAVSSAAPAAVPSALGALACCNVFHSLGPAELRELAAEALEKPLGPGETLVEHDALVVAPDGAVSGALAFLGGAPGPADTRCSEPCRLLVLPARAIEDLIAARPDAALGLLRLLVARATSPRSPGPGGSTPS